MSKKTYKCTSCGATFTDSTKFCMYCGSTVNENKVSKSSKKWIIPVAIGSGVLVVALIILIFLGTRQIVEKSNPVSQVMNYIENDELEDAIDIFEEQIKDDEDKYDELVSKLKEYLETGKTEYFEENITYNQLCEVIQVVSSFHITELSSDIISVQNFMETINFSRTAYKTAIAFYDKGDYAEAIENFSYVDAQDSYYEAAQEKKQESIDAYREKALEEAEEYVNEDDYLSAMAVLNEALKVIQNDSEIKTQISVYSQELDDNTINNAIEMAKNYHEKGEYIEALEVLENISAYDNETANSLYSSYYDEFLTNVLVEADKAFKTSGHNGALSKLNEYNLYFEDETLFVEKKEYYADLAPVSLSEMETFNSSYWNVKNLTNMEDHLGNVFDNCMYIEVTNNQERDRWGEYYVNNKYNNLTGTLSLSKETDADRIVKMEIYADDELIYTSPNITAKTDPVDFNVNIIGKKYIKIKVMGMGDNYLKSYLILSDAKLNKY